MPNPLTHALTICVAASSLLLSACGSDSDSTSITEQANFSRKSIEVGEYLIEDNLRFNATSNPSGLFTSSDTDTTSFSDAQARQQLLQLTQNNETSIMSYLEAGDVNGDPIILIHGQPTQAYLWRNVIPNLPQDAHIIAPDLMGYGQSSKPNIDFTFKQHSAYLQAFIKTLQLDNKPITFVLHDIGSVPGLAYAARFPQQIKGIAFFEAMLGPVPSFDVMPEQAQFFRSSAGNATIGTQNTFIEGMLVSEEMSSHTFTNEELTVYRAPFLLEEDRDVLAIVPKEVPVMGGADDGFGDSNIELLGRNAQYLMTDLVPRLFMYSNQGVLIPSGAVDQVKAGFNPGGVMTAVNMGDAKHFWQEEIPEELAAQISAWYNNL